MTQAARRAYDIRLKRAYEESAPEDGARVLVDRLWARGVSKERLALTAWLKDLAPSNELRRWFGHAPDRWAEFQSRYRSELAEKGDQLAPLLELARLGPLTLVYAAKDEAHNDAVVLREVLAEHLAKDA